MNAGRNPAQKSGNNTLIFIVGVLLLVLLGLIYVGSLRQSSIDELIGAAAPDSSSFVDNGSNLSVPETEETLPEPEPSRPKRDSILPVATPPPAPADTSTVSEPVEQPKQELKVETSGGDKIYLYRIRKGDTMYKIAAKFGNKPADVLAINGLSDMSVQADKEIKLKIKAIHPVADGEGMNAIAEKYSVPAKSIKVANGLTSDVLPVGSQLIIPLK